MNITPLFDHIVVERDATEMQTSAGIILTDKSAEKTSTGTVLAIGNGKWMPNETWQPLVVKVGDRIIFGKFAGQEIEVEKVKYALIKEEEILAIIE